MYYFILKTLSTTIEFTAMILLVLSLFRIYFRYELHKVFSIALILALISFYMRDYLGQFNYAFLTIFVMEIVLITLLFRLPIIFSFFICIIGNIATATFEGLAAAIGIQLGLTTQELILTSLPHTILWYVAVTLLQMVLVVFLQKYKIGFHFTLNDSLKKYNFWLSAILVISVVAIQVQSLSFKGASFHIFIPILLGAIFLLGIYLAYHHNQRLWKARRERLSKK